MDLRKIVFRSGKAFLMAVLAFAVLSPLAMADSGRGRHRQLYVVPAPGAVTIDGYLDDWDLSAQIEVFVQEATRSTQRAGFAVMYDAEALYVSGEVRDPNPMMNRHDPYVMPYRAWDADACQFRIVINPDAGYPVKESAFKYRGANAVEDTRDDIVHLLLWHYTDDASAHLQMHLGMGYRSPKGMEPHGLVPQDKFEAAFRKWDDGRGYTFEYRISWTTLGAENPPSAGDVVAGTMQMHWARPDGLSIGGGHNVARDIIGRSGVPFQSTEPWGRLIFTEAGNVPEELVLEGVPRERPLPLEFPYEMPADGEVTIQIQDADGIVHRVIVAQGERPGGMNYERWDGQDNHYLVDDHGDFLPAGEYQWRGVYNPERLRAHYRFSVHNSGRPPYRSADGKGGWGGDHGLPRDVIALKDGLLFCWDASEAGFGLIRTDLKGRKTWGSNQDATYLAADDDSIYIAGGRGFVKHEGVRKLALVDARPRTFNGGSDLILAPPGGDTASNEVSGLAVGDNKLYVAFAGRNLIAVYDLADASLKATHQVERPGRMAVRPDGSLAAISANEVVLIADGETAPWLRTNLNDPQGIAICKEGLVYVTNRGALQNVSVFNSDGSYVRSIGRDGGRPAMGTYDRTGMYMAGGLDIAPDGKLWVAESADSPKRISAWNAATGEYHDEFFGASHYFAHGYIDPARPDEIMAHNVLWGIDWDNYTTYPKFTMWRRTDPNMAPDPAIDGYIGVLRLITADNGRQFAWASAAYVSAFVIYMRDGDIFRPILGDFNPWRDRRHQANVPVVQELRKRMTEAGLASNRNTHPTRHILWQDTTDNGIVNEGEFLLREGPTAEFGSVIAMHKDLSLRLSCGRLLRPSQITEEGRPIYNLADARETPLLGKMSMGEGGVGWTAFDDTGAAYSSVVSHRGNRHQGLSGWNADGTLAWRFPDLIRWRDGRNLPTVGPGRFWGATQLMGVGGEFLIQQNYFGASHIFRRDGMYIGAVLGGGPRGKYDPSLTDTRYNGQSEGQGGSFVKLNINGEDRYFMIQGSHDVRVWEILGLNTLQDLPGGTYVHTEEAVAKAKAAYEKYRSEVSGVQVITIVPGRHLLADAPAVRRRIEGNRGFEVRAAYDAADLYVHYKVEAPHKLVNSQTNAEIVFRGGNLIDIQIAADTGADPNRAAPAPGDQRLLVTRQNNRPYAVLYQPRIAGFEGQRTVLSSPTGQEPFDKISEVEVGLEYEQTADGFEATVIIPMPLLGLQIRPGMELKMDLGYIFGDSRGTRTNRRLYINNDSPTAGTIDDIPHESRLEPAQWGTARVE